MNVNVKKYNRYKINIVEFVMYSIKNMYITLYIT